MGQTIKTEIKTLLHMKSIWICVIILIVGSLAYLVRGYSSAENSAKSITNIILELQETVSEENIVDFTELENEIYEIYKTYNPKMCINNAFGLFIGLGMLIVPVIASFFMGIEYSRNRVIKNKITHSTLFKVFLSKIVVFCGFLIVLCIVYSMCSYILSVHSWKEIENILNIVKIDYSQVVFIGMSRMFLIFLLVIAIFQFYSMVTMGVAAIMKSSTWGMVMVIIINYVVLPWKYSPHNVIYKLINSIMYISPVSSYEFVTAMSEEINVIEAMCFFMGYLIIMFFGILGISKLQKNG